MKPKFIPVVPFDMVIFGGTGDLAMRKILPALYYRDKDNQLPEEGFITGISRMEIDLEAYQNQVREAIHTHIKAEHLIPEVVDRFLSRLTYLQLDAVAEDGWEPLIDKLKDGEHRARAFYLSTPPSLFAAICRNLKTKGLICDNARVVVEKPIGHDLRSARKINREIGEYFEERQIYRIDHYLGKETVQNLMTLRFANAMFEPLWNHQWVDHIQITAAETIGIGGRGKYYDHSGALRDMVQNHLLQLLCITAMEPPVVFGPNAVRDEKLKILRALKPIGADEVRTKTVRGQYRKGTVNGEAVVGYLEEKDIPAESHTETLVVVKAEIENWRWAGVPFYLRTGKRLPYRHSEIVIEFRETPHLIFPKNAHQVKSNRLVIRLQPDEGIKMYLMTKVPGPGGMRMRQVPLNLSFAETFKNRYPGGYERLLTDVLRGNATLFMRRDEVEAAWEWVDPILKAWQTLHEPPRPYMSGTWGPAAAIALIERDGRTWYEEDF